MKPNKWVFPLFLLLALAVYYPTIGAGFVYDFLGWQNVYNQGNFSDVLNSFGYSGHHQLLHLVFYSLYSIFHIQGLPWYLAFTTLHALNAWLMFIWLSRLTRSWQIAAPPLVIVLVSMLFLLNPYAIEPVVWKACIHYLLSMSALLGIMIWVQRLIDGGPKKYFVFIWITYAASLFLLEIAFVTPLWISLFLVVSGWVLREKFPWRKAMAICVGLWMVFGLYLLLNRLTLGSWVGHYGPELHFRFDLLGLVATEIKYFIKHILFARYFGFHTKNLLFDTILSMPELVFMIMTAVMGLVILYLIKRRTVSPNIHLAFLGFAGSCIYILPVANLYFFHLQVGMNDRYSYVAVMMLGLAWLAWVATWRKVWAISLLGAILLIQVWLHINTTQYWKISTAILHELRDTFQWHDRDPVFVLNSPDNYKGIVIASIIAEPSGITPVIDYQTEKPFPGAMMDVYQFNMNTPDDGVVVEQTGPKSIKVTFDQWGNWWHKNGIGAGNYENEYYKVENHGQFYTLEFKQLPEKSAIIYHQGSTWKEFRFMAGENQEDSE